MICILPTCLLKHSTSLFNDVLSMRFGVKMRAGDDNSKATLNAYKCLQPIAACELEADHWPRDTEL